MKLRFAPLSKAGAAMLFEIFNQRCERSAILVTVTQPRKCDRWC